MIESPEVTPAESLVCRHLTDGACDGRCDQSGEDHCDCFGYVLIKAREILAALDALLGTQAEQMSRSSVSAGLRSHYTSTYCVHDLHTACAACRCRCHAEGETVR